MYAYFQAVDGEHFVRCKEAATGIAWDSAEVGSAVDSWTPLGAGDEAIPDDQVADVAREIAEQRISMEHLPRKLRTLQANVA